MKTSFVGRHFSILIKTVMIVSALTLLFVSLPSGSFFAMTKPAAKNNPTALHTPLPPTSTATQDDPPAITAEPRSTTVPAALQPSLSVSNPDTLRFVFPTPQPLTQSLWRPPLYNQPWAPTPHDHFFFARPIAADNVNWPIPDYRYGGTVIGVANLIHTGIDIEAPFGTPVLAAAPGTVVWAGFGLETGTVNPKDPYGDAVMIRHDFGYQGNRLETVYGHMSEIDVVKGQRVDTGTQLGLVGETGLATGPHLHFEVRVDEYNYFAFQNPELWLIPPQGWGVLAGRVMDNSGNLIHRLDIQVSSKTADNVWTVRTYGSEVVKNDPYYQENVVLSDLPAGDYTISIIHEGETFRQDIHINPGLVSYFSIKGTTYNLKPPPTPVPSFLVTVTPTPK